MDLNGVRSFLPSYNREQLGETVEVLPMVAGKMAESADAGRPVTTLRVRFETSPDLERMIEVRSSDLAGQTERCSISFKTGLLAYRLREGDRIRRMEPSVASPETYRVSRIGRLALDIEIAYLSRI